MISRFTIPFMTMTFILCSCHHTNKNTQFESTQLPMEKSEPNDTGYIDGMSQMEININYEEECLKLNEQVETEFSTIVESMGSNGSIIKEDLDEWTAYRDAVKALALEYYNDCDGSSSPMDYYEQRNHASILRQLSYEGLKNKSKQACDNIDITDAMIAHWYDKYIEGYDCFEIYSKEAKAKINDLVRQEHAAWKSWMAARVEIESKLSGQLKVAYHQCTYQTKRLKLIQLKNQDQGLGACSNDVSETLLKDDCTDEELMAYPGFYDKWHD